MKIRSLSIALFLPALFLFLSCRKDKHDETKYITLNETIQSGSTYSLNLGTYGDADDIATITKQPVHFSVSQIDKDNISGSIYHYSILSKYQDKETVEMILEEGHDGRRGNCDRKDKTVITINFTVH